MVKTVNDIVEGYCKKGLPPAKIFRFMKRFVSRGGVYKPVKRFRETGSCAPRIRSTPEKPIRTKELIKKVRERLRRNPSRSARKLAKDTSVSMSTMQRLLKDDLHVYPYKFTKRKLSHGNVLKRFFALRNEIASFVKMKNMAVTLLADATFQCNLAFLSDITHYLNELNLKLQGKKQIITQMYDHVKSFKVKLRLWIKQLGKGNLAHFSTLKYLGKVEAKCLKEYTNLLSNLLQQFDVRFADFEVLEPQFRLFSMPFAVKIYTVAEELQMELVELQCDTVLKQKYAEVEIPEFYTFLSQERFLKLLFAAARIIAMFRSTYVCEQFFSSMKVNNTVLRSCLKDEHLPATLRLVSADKLKPNIEVLIDEKHCQLSSQNKI